MQSRLRAENITKTYRTGDVDEEAQLGALISAQNIVVAHLDDVIEKCTIKAPAAGTVAQQRPSSCPAFRTETR